MASNPDRMEILVIDAGSTDETSKTLKNLPVTFFEKPEFKLRKHDSLNFGIQHAKSNVLLFLDADTLLPQSFDKRIKQNLLDNHAVGGAFEMRFIQPDWKLYLLSRLNQLRYRIWRDFYGDQAVFCKKEAAIEVGGFPDALMEAAYFSKSLKKLGKLKIINRPVLTSPRRFVDHGFWKVFWFDIKMWFRFTVGLKVETREEYWKANLENG